MSVVVNLEDLPASSRIYITEDTEELVWKTIKQDYGSIKKFAKSENYRTDYLYNLKNKKLAFPIELVLKILRADRIQFNGIKGRNNSKTIYLDFPLHVDEELLTRIKYSVQVNKEGVPHYITSELSLLDRFRTLLHDLGDVPISTYSNRGRYELRYPKLLNQILSDIEFRDSLDAKIDEIGQVEKGVFVLASEKVQMRDFEGQLFSRDKELALALEKGDSEKIARIMAEENSRIRSIIS